MPTYSVAGTLTIGVPVLFDSSSIDNYYSFYLNSASTVLIVADDLRKSYVSQVNLYDSSFNKIQGWSYITSESISLQAGSYYFQPNDNNYGYLTIHKNASTLSATPLANGEFVRFYGGFYSFTLNSQGTVLITGGDSNNSAIEYVKIFDSNFNEVKEYSNLTSESLSLNAGIYYIQADEPYTNVNSGVFSVSSNSISGSPIASTPIVNTTVSFDNTYFDNFYSLILNSADTIVISGTDGNGGIINKLKVFDNNFNEITSFDTSVEKSLSLNTGTYYFQPIDSNGGTFTVSLTTPSTLPPTLSTQDISTFVERLYTNVLGRPSDSSGLSSWVNALQTSNASDVAKSFFNSQEFLNANYSDTAYVQKLYSTFLDRTYDQGGLTHWLSQLSGGMSRSAVLDGFAQSSEFAAIAQSYGIDAYESGGGTTTPSNPNLSPIESFVERFYTEVLGRASDASGLANWSAGLENGSKTADDIAQGFFFSQEFINRNLSNSDFIDVAYETLLNRQADSGGKASWLAALNGGMSRSTMLDGFIYSAEFDTLADSYGIEVGNEIEYTIVDESSYDGHTLAIDTQGNVYAWGDNLYGQIGDGTILDRNDPVKITTLSNIKFVEAGAWCSFAISNSGDVYAWGSQSDGQLGNGISSGYATRPLLVQGLSDIIQIDSGFDHVLAVDSSGNVYGWGENYDGQLGPLRPGANQTTPLHLGFVSNIVEVSAGTNLSIALDNQGKVFYWGYSSAYDTSYTYPKTISSSFNFADIDETTLIDINGVSHSFYDFI